MQEPSEEECVDQLVQESFSDQYKDGFANYKGYRLTKYYAKYLQEIDDFEVYDDDVWVTSFPKCGTTWTQEIVWCLSNNVDLEGAKESLETRFPFLEFFLVYEGDDPNDEIAYVVKSIQLAREAKRPRFIKSHLPWDLLPKQIRSFEKRPKVIHVIRNPKDACISYYHHCKIFHGYTGDLETFCKLFMHGKVLWGPIFDNMLSYWSRRNEPNILIVRYEDMKKDLMQEIKVMGKFLKKSISYEQMVKLMHHVSFESMKKNNAVDKSELVSMLIKDSACVNPHGIFIRQGIVGGHKLEMTAQIIKELDAWISEGLKNTGLVF